MSRFLRWVTAGWATVGFHDRLSLTFAGVGLAVLIIYTTFAGLQWHEMHHSLLVDQRAWVGVVSADPPDLKPKPDFFVTLHVTNSGHTPALNFHSETVLHSLTKDERFEPVYDATVETPSRGVIQPGEVIFLQSIRWPITQPQIDWVKSGQYILYVYGRMSYDDIFHATHHTTFCKEILSESLVRDCGTYNSAD
jgi:hypothetical protein